MSKKWTLVRYKDGDKTQSVTEVVTSPSCEMDKNRTLVFGGSDYGSALRVNKDEWISVQSEDAQVEEVSSRKFGARVRKPRPSRAKK
jgi:hypothetical protein